MKANFPDLIVEQMKTLTRVQNNAGCQIDPLVPSIQTVGTKTKGFIYADNNQPNTAWTIKSDYVGDSTEIVINDASVFERIDMKAILGKLQNLDIIEIYSLPRINQSENVTMLEFTECNNLGILVTQIKSTFIKTPDFVYVGQLPKGKKPKIWTEDLSVGGISIAIDINGRILIRKSTDVDNPETFLIVKTLSFFIDQ